MKLAAKPFDLWLLLHAQVSEWNRSMKHQGLSGPGPSRLSGLLIFRVRAFFSGLRASKAFLYFGPRPISGLCASRTFLYFRPFPRAIYSSLFYCSAWSFTGISYGQSSWFGCTCSDSSTILLNLVGWISLDFMKAQPKTVKKNSKIFKRPKI